MLSEQISHTNRSSSVPAQSTCTHFAQSRQHNYHFFFVTFLTHKTVPTVSVTAGFYVDLNPVVSMRLFALRFSFCLCACGLWFGVLNLICCSLFQRFLIRTGSQNLCPSFSFTVFLVEVLAMRGLVQENMGSDWAVHYSLSLLTILIVLFKTPAVWLISNSPTILLGSAIAFNRSCKQVYRMLDGMSAIKPSPVIKSDKLSYCCKQCSMTLLRKASALQVSCSIRMGLGRDPLSLSTCRVGSRATTTLLKKTDLSCWKMIHGIHFRRTRPCCRAKCHIVQSHLLLLTWWLPCNRPRWTVHTIDMV